MAIPKLIDEINRLFEEMVRDPWARPTRPLLSPERPRGETQLDIDMPIAGGQLGDVSVAIDERRLTVRARRRSQLGGSGGADTQLERSFLLPEDTDVSGVEVHFEGDVLHVRIRLHPEKRVSE